MNRIFQDENSTEKKKFEYSNFAALYWALGAIIWFLDFLAMERVHLGHSVNVRWRTCLSCNTRYHRKSRTSRFQWNLLDISINWSGSLKIQNFHFWMEQNEWNFVAVLCTKRREVAVRSLSPFSPLQRQVRQVQINNGFRSTQEKKIK